MAAGLGGSANADAGTPINVAIACSNCARATPVSMACALTVRYCVSAWATSTALATPPLNRTRASCRASASLASVFSSRCFCTSRPRS